MITIIDVDEVIKKEGLMENKDDIRNSPWLLFVYTRSYYFNKEFQIEIELKGKDENLFLFSIKDKKGFCIGDKGRNFHEFDSRGKDFFNKLTPTFGKVWVHISGEKKPRSFANLNKLITKIMP